MSAADERFPLELVDVADVKVTHRYRQDVGDLKPLAESIDRLGLMSPIGLTCENELIFGQRRLRAVVSLGWTKIPAFILDLPLLDGQHDENECRLPFTVSERVAIAKALKERWGNRAGERTDLAAPVETPPRDQPAPGEKTRDAAARIAGFGNSTTLREAEKVISNGVPELVAAMDEGTIAVHTAADVAVLPPPKQREVVSKVKAAKKAGRKPKKAARQALAEARPTEPLLDATGQPVPEALLPVWAALSLFDELEGYLRRAQDVVGKLAVRAGGERLKAKLATPPDKGSPYRDEHLDAVISRLRASRPYAARCPACQGEGDTPPGADCCTCWGRGWTAEQTWKEHR